MKLLKLGSIGVVHEDVEFGEPSDTPSLCFDASDLVRALPNVLDTNNDGLICYLPVWLQTISLVDIFPKSVVPRHLLTLSYT